MSIPLCYYLSYLLAAPATDFRLMFPATLFVQAVVSSLLMSFFFSLSAPLYRKWLTL
ncbi:MAG: hypothetical protein ACREEM_39005 [Blastocatellia bacterium]